MRIIARSARVFPKARNFLSLLPLCAAVLSGCSTVKTTDTPRTATEQLLLSTASDHATDNFDLGWIQGKKTFVEDKYFESYDKGYVISLIRQHLSQNGALLVKTDDKADVIVEIRSGALAINSSQFLFGLPAFTLPVPLAGPLTTPEIAFYKNQKQDSIGKFALVAYMRNSGEYLQSAGPVDGYAHFHRYSAFGYGWLRTDIPELKHRPKSKGENRETPTNEH